MATVERWRAASFDRRTNPYLHTTAAGLRFHLVPGEHIDRFIAKEGIYERRLLTYLKGVIPQGAVMLDIGANIGNHSVYLADTCSEVHCFECNPTAAERLKANIAANGYERVRVHEYGLGAKDGELAFNENVQGNLGSSCVAQGEAPEGWRQKTVEIREAGKAVAALCLKRLDFIKMDVERMEELVIQSLKDVIDRYRPLVAFEHDETMVDAESFGRIRACFPKDYRIMEAVTAPSGPFWTRLAWNLRHDGGPVLTEVTKPERRLYQALLAIPGERDLTRTRR